VIPKCGASLDQGLRYGRAATCGFGLSPNLSYDVELEVTRALNKHVAGASARSQRGVTGRTVGIALPPGYVFRRGRHLGMDSEQRSRGGASDSDISAVLMWEGILCSRRGIPFDFLVDASAHSDLG